MIDETHLKPDERALLELSQDATPAPWIAPLTGFDITTEPDPRGYHNVIVHGSQEDEFGDELYSISETEDRELIVQSRNMLEPLLQRLAELRAENERLRSQRCRCDMRTKLVGDGCQHCNPDLAAECAKMEESEPA